MISGAGRITQDTRQKIFSATEDLLARQGIRGTTLRDISQAADTNLAAVNYHFGSKQDLVREVIRRRLDELNAERLARLDALDASDENTGSQTNIAAAVDALIGPALDLSRSEGGGRFVRILARAYAESDTELQLFLSRHYGDVMRRFAAHLRRRLPHLDEAELRSRITFVVGALTYAMADFGGHRDAPSPQLAEHLRQFATAGLLAPANDDSVNGQPRSIGSFSATNQPQRGVS